MCALHWGEMAQGLPPDVLSLPRDASAPLSPLEIATEYKRDAAAHVLRTLQALD